MDELVEVLPGKTAEAVAPRERIVAIDVLRGMALLGILILNIQAFSMPFSAYSMPRPGVDDHGANRVVLLCSLLFADQKFMPLFSMLFGAGIILMTRRLEASTGRSAGVHYRRMAVLLVFGLLHGFLLWAGDILYSYAVCGMLVYPLRKLRPCWQVFLGILCLGVGASVMLVMHFTYPYWPTESQEAVRSMLVPTPESYAKEVATYRGSWATEVQSRFVEILLIDTLVFAKFLLWRAAGFMLLGMALFQWGVFSASRSPAFYRRLAVAGLGLGLPLVGFGIYLNEQHQWDPIFVQWAGGQFNYWAGPLVTLGYVGLLTLVYLHPEGQTFTSSLAAVGQMAFTNYLMQTVICTEIFYGRGLGLFDALDRPSQMMVVLGVWVVQLLSSQLWLRFFRMGPAEWLWRALTYGRWQPWLRVADQPSSA